MQKAWVDKQAVLDNSKSLAIRGWLSKYNVSVPCSVQEMATLHLGYTKMVSNKVGVRLTNPFGSTYTVLVPIQAVSVEHYWFKHSIRLHVLPQALEVMRASSTRKV